MKQIKSGMCRASIFGKDGNAVVSDQQMAIVTDSIKDIYPVISFHCMHDKTGLVIVLSDEQALELIEHLTELVSNKGVLQ